MNWQSRFFVEYVWSGRVWISNNFHFGLVGKFHCHSNYKKRWKYLDPPNFDPYTILVFKFHYDFDFDSCHQPNTSEAMAIPFSVSIYFDSYSVRTRCILNWSTRETRWWCESQKDAYRRYITWNVSGLLGASWWYVMHLSLQMLYVALQSNHQRVGESLWYKIQRWRETKWYFGQIQGPCFPMV